MQFNHLSNSYLNLNDGSFSNTSRSTLHIMLALALSLTLAATGCASQWLSVALADLPVLTQMAINIAGIVTTLQSGKQLDPAEAAAIQNLSAEASKDLNLLQTLYSEYKASPNLTTLQKIDDAITAINQNLPALLQSAHITDSALAARISAGVDLILTTVSSFASLMPQHKPGSSQKNSQAVAPILHA
ncbi:MAG: hypothetical protein JOY93_00620, partial [Acidobacteriales bacterium]|nr:hypothetical protein [Terriglobales bacterium]